MVTTSPFRLDMNFIRQYRETASENERILQAGWLQGAQTLKVAKRSSDLPVWSGDDCWSVCPPDSDPGEHLM